MFFLPFLIDDRDGNYYYYPGNEDFENKLNFKKTKIFNHSYFSGKKEEIEKIIGYYPDEYLNKAKIFFNNFFKTSDYFLIKDKKYNLDKIYFAGVLNVTPDSFSDGNLYFNKEKAIEKGIKLEEEGADILDIGGQSTRPGSEEITEEEEIKRVIPVIEELSKKINIPISIDTTRAEVAEKAFNSGATILNDISALHFDDKMCSFLEKWKPSILLMHIKGRPKDMQKDTKYEHLPYEILSFLNEGIEKAINSGIEREKILVDPGIGFGKDFSQNIWILNNLSFLKNLGCGILCGTSRKTFIGKILNNEPQDRLYGTIASNLIAVKNGARFLRVHDVKPHKEFFKVLEEIENAKLV